MAKKTWLGSREVQSDKGNAYQQSKCVNGDQHTPAQIRLVDGFLYQGVPTAAEGPFQGSLGLCLIHL